MRAPTLHTHRKYVEFSLKIALAKNINCTKTPATMYTKNICVNIDTSGYYVCLCGEYKEKSPVAYLPFPHPKKKTLNTSQLNVDQ